MTEVTEKCFMPKISLAIERIEHLASQPWFKVACALNFLLVLGKGSGLEL